MKQSIAKRSHKSGLPPGTMIHTGKKRAEETKISVINFNENIFEQEELKTVEDSCPFLDKHTITWVNVDGVHQIDVIEKIGKQFDLHPLVLEDIVNPVQRPKIEEFDGYLFIVTKMLYRAGDSSEVTAEQVSFIIGPHYVISFQEKVGDVFDPVRERIMNAKGRIRKMGADYLAYVLLDTIVDNYFVILEKCEEEMEELDNKVLSDPSPQILQELHRLKGEMTFLRKAVWPLREVINGLQRSESSLMKDSTMIYLRDVYDHTIQIIDTIETYRDLIAGMLDTYLSSVSNKMNEVMKVLTIIATIFIPLTFIAGIYGMNFNPEVSLFNMPELNWKYGYVMSIGIMALVALVMVYYFKRKKWL